MIISVKLDLNLCKTLISIATVLLLRLLLVLLILSTRRQMIIYGWYVQAKSLCNLLRQLGGNIVFILTPCFGITHCLMKQILTHTLIETHIVVVGTLIQKHLIKNLIWLICFSDLVYILRAGYQRMIVCVIGLLSCFRFTYC